MASKGAYLELCYSSLSPAWRNITIDEVAGAIRAVGPEHYILASDLGQVHNPPPPEGLRIYIMMLMERGFSPEEIRVMVKDNPEKLLGLDPA
jgi:predicted metal-dependent TIM-barrel fold hydrolase